MCAQRKCTPAYHTAAYQVLSGIDFMRKWCCRAQYSSEELQRAYKVEADVPLTFHIIIPIFIPATLIQIQNQVQIRPRCPSQSSGFNSTWAEWMWVAADLITRRHSPYWISHPASSYTPIVLIYFSVRGNSLSFPLTPILSMPVHLSLSVCLSVCLLNYRCALVIWMAVPY